MFHTRFTAGDNEALVDIGPSALVRTRSGDHHVLSDGARGRGTRRQLWCTSPTSISNPSRVQFPHAKVVANDLTSLIGDQILD